MFTARQQQAPTAGLGGNAVFGAARLSATLEGRPDNRPPLVLLHGLTFDRRMWQPAVDALRRRDPGRQVLALDLPGHGRSPAQPSCDLEDVAAAVASAVDDAGLDAPVIVGHSMAAIVATVFAASYTTAGVVNVDQTLDAGFVHMLQANREAVIGPGFSRMWTALLSSMHIDLLSQEAQRLLSTAPPRQDVVLAYWRQPLELPATEIQSRIDEVLATLKQRRVPYMVIAGHEYDAGYAAWLRDVLPRATLTIFPNGGHFPHLADPDRFADCLASTGQWLPEFTGETRT
ncbi:MAG: alpha/beta hydrolase [Candidatus Dormibacter sp.]